MPVDLKRIPHVAVVGGGVSGLAVAHHLFEESQRKAFPIRVSLLEASAHVGGVVHTVERDGFLLEGGPDSFISEKPWALRLCQRMGLEPRLIGTGETHRRSFIVSQGRLFPIPEGFYLLAPTQIWPFISTPIFTWGGKLRMAADLILPRRNGTLDNFDESLASFVRRRLGREALERIAQPLVSGIYTADPEQLSLRASMPRFLEMEQQYRSIILGMLYQRQKMLKVQKGHSSGPRYGLFVSFDQGMKILVEQLEGRLPPEWIHRRTAVESILPQQPSRGWLLRLQNGDMLEVDAVCLALPAYQSARLIEGFEGSLAEKLKTIPYASTAIVNLAYRREDIPHPMDGFGFVVPAIEKRQLLACTFSHIKFEGRAPDGYALLRAFVGGALQPKAFDMEDDEMIQVIRQNLQQLLGVEHDPVFAALERHPLSMAQYRVGHLDLVKEIEAQAAAYPTLQIAGNGMAGIGIPDCVHRGEQCADRIINHLEAKSRESE